MLQQIVIHRLAVGFQRLRGPFQIDGVPQHDGGRHQVQATGTVALLLEATVTDLAQSTEEYGAGQRIAGFALVQPGMHAATQPHVLQPVQNKQRALDAAQLA